MDKIKKYFKGLNPYLVASAAIVGVSALIIFSLVKDSTPQTDKEVIVIEESSVTIEEEALKPIEDLKESVVVEDSYEASEDLEKQLPETKEEAVPEKIEEQEHIQEVVTIPDVVKEPEEKQPESVIKQDAKPKNEPVSEPKEPEVVEQPEEVPDEETEEHPQEPTPEPEVPNIVPEEEEPIPEEPKVHEHSWIFESYYQSPTCSNGGLVNEICAHCGETQITGGTPTGEHFFEVETVGDCCSAEVVACSECNYREVRGLDPANHIDVEVGFCYGCGHNVK